MKIGHLVLDLMSGSRTEHGDSVDVSHPTAKVNVMSQFERGPTVNGVATHFRCLLVMLIALFLASTHCRWREGRSVWISVYDAGGDSDAEGFSDAPDGGCLVEQGAMISPEELLGLLVSASADLVILDVRSAEMCTAARIPGALCNPLEDGELTTDVDPTDESGWLILYDSAGEIGADILTVLPSLCRRHIVMLEGGFGAWAVHPDFPLEEGAP